MDVLVLEALSFAWNAARWLARHRERERWWLHVAEAAGLTDVRPHRALGWTWGLDARAGRLTVRLHSYVPREDALGANIAIGGLPDLLDAPNSDPARLLGASVLGPGGDVDVPPVSGPPLLLCAVLDEPTRRLVRNLFAGRIDVDGEVRTWESAPTLRRGTLAASYVAGRGASVYELADVLGALLDIGRRLLPPPDIDHVVAERVGTDPVPALRLYHLRTVLAHGTDASAREQALAAGREDADPLLRLEAGRASGEAGKPVLLALVTDARAPDAVRAASLRALQSDLPVPTVREALTQALAASTPETALACVDVLATHGAGQAAAIVSALIHGHTRVAAGAARALGTLATAEAETALVAALDRRGEVARAAAVALAQAGTVAAVLPLQELALASPKDRELARTCRASVAAIQSRLFGADRGQVGLADEDAGHVAVADDERGRVSFHALTTTGER